MIKIIGYVTGSIKIYRRLVRSVFNIINPAIYKNPGEEHYHYGREDKEVMLNKETKEWFANKCSWMCTRIINLFYDVCFIMSYTLSSSIKSFPTLLNFCQAPSLAPSFKIPRQ